VCGRMFTSYSVDVGFRVRCVSAVRGTINLAKLYNRTTPAWKELAADTKVSGRGGERKSRTRNANEKKTTTKRVDARPSHASPDA